ncbi:MAG: hypothetical protein RLY31_2584 [Bacteroidota bacterium]
MRNAILYNSLLWIFFLWSCQDNSKSAVGSTTLVAADVRMYCQPSAVQNNESGAPEHEVFAVVGEKSVKVADLLNCGALAPDEYEQYQVPADAVVALLGWWAGTGDVVYGRIEHGKLVIRQGGLAEEDAGSIDYRIVMTIE